MCALRNVYWESVIILAIDNVFSENDNINKWALCLNDSFQPQVVEPEEIVNKTGLTAPHTSHCLANGQVMISAMGNEEGEAKGKFMYLGQWSQATCCCCRWFLSTGWEDF